MTSYTRQIAFGFEPESTTTGLKLQVVIERYDEPIVGMTMKLDRELLIGRCPSAGLIIEGRLVSRQHAWVRAAPFGLEIEDVSSNGTLVDRVTLIHARRCVAMECKLLVGCTRIWLRRVPAPEPVVAAPQLRCYTRLEPASGDTQVLGSESEPKPKPKPGKRWLFSAAGGVRDASEPSHSSVDALFRSLEDYTEL